MSDTRAEIERKRIAEVQAHVDEEVLVAESFAPNARYYGAGTILSFLSLSAERRAIRKGGLAVQTIWAVTEKKLYIFETKYRFLKRRNDVLRPLGEWTRSEIKVRRVAERSGVPTHPSYAVAFTDSSGRYVEMQAAIHSPAAKKIIDLLISDSEGNAKPKATHQ